MQGDEERGGSWFPCVGARCLGVKTARCVGDEARLYRVQKRGGNGGGTWAGGHEAQKISVFFLTACTQGPHAGERAQLRLASESMANSRVQQETRPQNGTPTLTLGGGGSVLQDPCAGRLEIASGHLSQRSDPPRRAQKGAGGVRKGRGMSLMPGIYGDQLTRTRGMGKKIRGGGRMGQKGELHAAGSGRMARYGSDGPSQRPASPRRAQKGAGDIVSSVESLTRTDTKT